MQWDDSLNGGFSKVKPWLKVNPNYVDINVKNNLEDENSIFNHYKKLIKIRKNEDVVVYEMCIRDRVDTTGAGDSFIGSFLFKLLQDNINIKNLDSISDEMLKEYLVFSNYYATYSTTKKGAIGSYATLDEITKYMNK